MRGYLIQFVDIFSALLIFAIFVRVVFSWLRVNMFDNPLFRLIHESTEPILRLARRVTPRVGMLDFSPIVAFLAIDFIRIILMSILSSV
ncbi:MAG: hypothetical protein UY05_C0023G0009 [Candidatus Peregrinibacteria bacterium GW2011_GWA2_47_7]|nr:MAG: hypothetical protein UY05_C0023G0009 [Candidatus Peregrinibacteria bacterium GW2011_GWA2_47_7]